MRKEYSAMCEVVTLWGTTHAGPFYQILALNEIKQQILHRLNRKTRYVEYNDTVDVVLLCHGRARNGALKVGAPICSSPREYRAPDANPPMAYRPMSLPAHVILEPWSIRYVPRD